MTILILALALDGDAAETYRTRVLPILEAACAGCHGGAKPKAKLSLAGPRTAERLAEDGELWFRVLDQIESGAMPPDGEAPLSAERKKAVVDWIRGELTDLQAAKRARTGRARLRRLSREEYANTILDLFGYRPAVAQHLPDDGRVDGYDKTAAALPLASSGADGYVRMAELLTRRVLRPPQKDVGVVRAKAFESEQSKGHILELPDGWKVSFNTDLTSGPLRGLQIREPGVHKLRMHVYGYQTDKPLPFAVFSGFTHSYPQSLELAKLLEAPPGKPAVVETEIYLRTSDANDLGPGTDGFRLVPLGLGVPVPKNHQASQCKKPGLAVQWVDVEGPSTPLPGDRWLTADFPAEMVEALRRNAPRAKGKDGIALDVFLGAARATFQRVAARLYRREPTGSDVAPLLSELERRIQEGASPRDAFLEQVVVLLTSPDFLCVIEPAGKLDDFAIATRLSLFLWNAGPDEALLAAAKAGKLRSPAGLREQTERLLNDPRSRRFVNDFGDQWLGLRGIGDTTPDSKLYPEYDEYLKHSSLLETRETLKHILDHDLSVKDFVAPSWAMLNERLTKHYNIAGVAGVAIRKVELPPDSLHGGLWTQSAILKVTANGTSTSPVKRGVWVSERLLGIRIPPPPSDISPVEPDVRGAKTLREQIALHAANGTCASCHARFDPYGFALESFDVTGAFRTRYREADAGQRGAIGWKEGLPVDCSGKTPDGRAFADIRELRRLLAADTEPLARGVARHLVTYATGAPAGPLDEKAVRAIVRAAAPSKHGFRSLIHALVQSELFLSK